MSNLLELNLTNGLNIDKDLTKASKDLGEIVGNVIDKGAEYAIKASPVNEHIKDVLIDVKDSLRTKDFKEILKTTISSSIREGLELLSFPKNVLSDLNKIKDAAMKGGLKSAISTGLDIFVKNTFGKNIFYPYINKFLTDIKQFVGSKSFNVRLENSINKVKDKIDDFKDMCKKWEKAYQEFDLKSINEIASTLSKNEKSVRMDVECVNENKKIQNITELVNTKNDKLTDMQFQICSNL